LSKRENDPFGGCGKPAVVLPPSANILNVFLSLIFLNPSAITEGVVETLAKYFCGKFGLKNL